MSIKWRETFRATDNHSMPIGGLAGRAIGAMEQRGLAFFKRDEPATMTLWSTYETTGTNINCRGYAQYIFKAESSIVALLAGTGAIQGRQTGTMTFIRGTGRFLGISGEAAFSAVAVTSSEAGNDTYADVKGSYSLLQALTPP
jgi:hypothetical protein